MMGTNGIDSSAFRKQMTELFPSNRPIPPQTVCGRQKAKSFVPSLILSDSDEVNVKNVKMTTSVDEKDGVTHHYSVTWSDVILKDLKNLKGGSTEEMGSLRKTTSIMKIQEGLKTGKIQCDGPCGQMVKLIDTVQFGCDHVICDKCRQSQYSTALFDGSPGCCHWDCLDKAKTDGQKLRSGRRLDSMASLVSLRSNEGPWEVLNVHVSIVNKCNSTVHRTQLEYEFPSQTRVAELTKTLEPYQQTISSGRSYYSMQKPQSIKDLQPISLNDTNLRFYHLPGYKPLSTGKLFVLIVGKNVKLY